MNSARENILRRLRTQTAVSHDRPDQQVAEHGWDLTEKIARLTRRMQAVRTEVHCVDKNHWTDWLIEELPGRNLNRILTGNTPEGLSFRESAGNRLDVELYTQSIERFKTRLFSDFDAGITTTRGGIADTGSLILWPDENEPRLLSLVPPVHVALLRAENIYENLAQAVRHQHWNQCMPTNALLISGPSKTADIQQTLAYGIHGPKQLIVLILQ